MQPDPVGDAPGGLGALAAEMEASNAIMESFGSPVSSVRGGDVLAEALKLVLKSIARTEALDAFVDANASVFATYAPDGEQTLEWTELHQQYVRIVEGGIAEALDELECSAEELFEYASAFIPTEKHDKADKLLCKLLAMNDYACFCDLMVSASRCPMAI